MKEVRFEFDHTSLVMFERGHRLGSIGEARLAELFKKELLEKSKPRT